jgi:hypothetical protein
MLRRLSTALGVVLVLVAVGAPAAHAHAETAATTSECAICVAKVGAGDWTVAAAESCCAPPAPRHAGPVLRPLARALCVPLAHSARGPPASV